MTDVESDSFINKEFHRIIAENTAMWLNMLDKDARVVMWNKAAERISGYTQEEVLGRSDIWELLYPDEDYRNEVYAKALEILKQGKEVVDFETTICCKDGSQRRLSWNSHDIKNQEGEVVGSLALARDVSELHASNQRLHELARELECSNQRLMQLTEMDELTGLFNRRAMDKMLKSEWERHIRGRIPLSLLYIDIDYFKQYNDTYGHSQGDVVLVDAAEVFSGCARRATDKVARFGGEEFAIILPDTEHEEAMTMAQKLRHDVAQRQIEHGGSLVADVLTVSVGVATIRPTRDDSLESLKGAADRALYRAKEHGRNRVENIEIA